VTETQAAGAIAAGQFQLPDWMPLEVSQLVNLGIALAVLIIGWIVAKILAAVVGGVVRRLEVDRRITGAVGEAGFSIEDLAGSVVFYLAMLWVLVEFFRRLELPGLSEPLNQLVNRVLDFLPQVGGALILLVVAWIIATLVRALVNRLADATNLDQRLATEAAMGDEQPLSVASSLGSAAYYLIFLFFLPGILGALGLSSLAGPVGDLLGQLLGYLPNIFGAAIIFGIGYFAARIVRQLVANLLSAAGADAFGERFGFTDGMKLSSLVGTVVYAFIMIPLAIQALNTLDIDAISGPATNMLQTIFDAIPGIFGAALVLIFSWIIGRWVSGLITNLLQGVGFDRVTGMMGLREGAMESAAGRRPSEIAGYVALVFIMLFAAMEAAGQMGFDGLGDVIRQLIDFSGNVILATVVLGVGIYFANALRNIVLGSGVGGEHTATLARIAQVAVIVLAAVIGLQELNIGDDVVGRAFTEVIDGLALGVALAAGLSIGLGGVDVARGYLNKRFGDGGGD
jgi:hypothetical protein